MFHHLYCIHGHFLEIDSHFPLPLQVSLPQTLPSIHAAHRPTRPAAQWRASFHPFFSFHNASRTHRPSRCQVNQWSVPSVHTNRSVDGFTVAAAATKEAGQESSRTQSIDGATTAPLIDACQTRTSRIPTAFRGSAHCFSRLPASLSLVTSSPNANSIIN